MRTIFWDFEQNELRAIDQRLLPVELKVVSFHTSADVAKAIENMTVRGAPAIGAAAAFGLALEARESKAKDNDHLLADLKAAGAHLKSARPTAVNLAWAVDKVMEATLKGSSRLSLAQLRVEV